MKNINKILISTVIVGVLGFQTLAAFNLTSVRFWPFVYYDMYSLGYNEGDAMNYYELTCLLDDGTQISLTREDLNYSFYQYMYGPINAFRFNDMEALHYHAKKIEKLKNVKLAAIQLEAIPYVVSKQGYTKRERKIIKTVQLNDKLN